MKTYEVTVKITGPDSMKPAEAHNLVSGAMNAFFAMFQSCVFWTTGERPRNKSLNWHMGGVEPPE